MLCNSARAERERRNLHFGKELPWSVAAAALHAPGDLRGCNSGQEGRWEQHLGTACLENRTLPQDRGPGCPRAGEQTAPSASHEFLCPREEKLKNFSKGV